MTIQVPEFSRPVAAGDIGAGGRRAEIVATEPERAALAARFSLKAIDAFRAVISLNPIRGGRMIRVEGRFEADVVQTCVVTLEPVRNHVVEAFTAVFAEPGLIPDDGVEVDLDFSATEEDLPEPIEAGLIDIGELTAQHLSLALDPYPRVPGVSFAGMSEETQDEIGDGEDRPFGVLARLKQQH